MIWPAYFFAVTSVAGWIMFAQARRSHARSLRKQAAEHRISMATYGMLRFAQGLNHDKERRRDAQNWREAMQP